MRRKDREISREAALKVIDQCSYATLATTNPDQTPYAVPLNIVRKGDALYFHCAMAGHKHDNLQQNPAVCLTCVDKVFAPQDDFTMHFTSATVKGTAHLCTDEAERTEALRLLCQRHTPAYMAEFEPYLAKFINRTAVWRIDISEITGKRNGFAPAAP